MSSRIQIWTAFRQVTNKSLLTRICSLQKLECSNLNINILSVILAFWNCPDSDYTITEQNALRAIMFRPELARIAHCKIRTTLGCGQANSRKNAVFNNKPGQNADFESVSTRKNTKMGLYEILCAQRMFM